MTGVTRAEEARRLIQAAFPDLGVVDVRYLAEGWDSTVFEANGRLIFRFPKREQVSRALEREVALLARLRPRLPVPVPDVRYAGGPAPGYPWSFAGYPRLSGTPLSEVPPAATPALASDLAGFLSALHATPVEEIAHVGLPAFAPGGWLGRYRALVDGSRATVRERLGAEAEARLVSWWDRYLSSDEACGFRPVLIHGDLAAEHILCARVDRRLRVSGVIDWADAMIGDPALDLAGLPEVLARAVVERLAGRGSSLDDPGVWTRRAACRRAGPLHAIEAGLATGRGDLVASGIEGLRRQLEP